MGRGSSKVGGGSGGSATAVGVGGWSGDTAGFLQAANSSESDTLDFLESIQPGSQFSLVPDGGTQRVDYKKMDDGRWQMTRSVDGNITSQMMIDADTAANHAFHQNGDIFSANIKAPAAIPKSAVNVSASEYSRSHMGKSPSGTGVWAFDIGGRQVFINGKYSDAKKKAIAQAAAQGIRRIMTLG